MRGSERPEVLCPRCVDATHCTKTCMWLSRHSPQMAGCSLKHILRPRTWPTNRLCWPTSCSPRSTTAPRGPARTTMLTHCSTFGAELDHAAVLGDALGGQEFASRTWAHCPACPTALAPMRDAQHPELRRECAARCLRSKTSAAPAASPPTAQTSMLAPPAAATPGGCLTHG